MIARLTRFASTLSILLPLAVSAGLEETMEEMFMANVTEPKALDAARRGGYDLGGLSMAIPVESLRIVQINEPRISASCSHIDIYFGGFSYITDIEWESMIRKIAAGTVAYGVQLAIQQMCQGCSSVISDLRDSIEEITGSLNNTCKISQAIAEKSGLGDFARNLGCKLSKERGYSTDSQQCESKGGDTVAAETYDANYAVGNMVFRALQSAPIPELFPGLPTLNTDDRNALILSFFGTEIYDPGVSGDAPTPPTSWAPILDLNDLIFGAGDGQPLPVYRCADANCLQLKRDTMDFAGLVPNIADLMLGYKDRAAPGDNLLGALCSNAAPSEDVQRFAQHIATTLTFDLRAILAGGACRNKARVEEVGSILAVQLALRHGVHIGEALRGIGYEIFSGNKDAIRPADWQQSIHKLDTEIANAQRQILPIPDLLSYLYSGDRTAFDRAMGE